ncbi:MAG: transporter [Oscillospiraceae bacterium]|nr:transporter [Oscillospiraceae bacterium]
MQYHGFDVAIRLSPLLEEYMDFDKLNNLGIDKCIVEFLRFNSWIKNWFPGLNYEKYTLYDGNYKHLPLEEKLRIIDKVKIPSITVCEKVPEHYDYWQKNFNPNPADCCNLRINPQLDLTVKPDREEVRARNIEKRKNHLAKLRHSESQGA